MVDRYFLSRTAFFAAFFALGVIALGACTRLMDAGLGCPDWPGCYGHFIAPLTDSIHSHAGKAWIEMIHRYFVGALSLFIIMIVLMIFSQKKCRTRFNIILAILLMALLGYQIMLGQWTVTLKLLPIIVSQHLLGGYFILATLWSLHLNNKYLDTKIYSAEKNKLPLPTVLPYAVLGLILLLSQIALGAWTSTNYASLSCTDFPFCLNDQSMTWHFREAFNLFSPVGVNYEGGILPTVVRQTIQMTHRFGALILIVYFILLTAWAGIRLKQHPALLKSLYIVVGLLCLQICLGISNVIFKLPFVSALCHTLFAALLLLALLTFIFNCIHVKREART